MPSLSFEPAVPVFDANVCVGDYDSLPLEAPSDLFTEMDRRGVGRAVVYHAQGHIQEHSPITGNELLGEWGDGESRLVPQWSALPTADSLAQLGALHEGGKVSSVRLSSTREAGLPFRPWAYDPLLSWLSEREIPVWIPLPDADAHELVTTLGAYPDLVTVLVGAHYLQSLWVRPMLRALPKAHLELSRYEGLGEVEALVGEFGIGRFLYGSWFPLYAMGPVLFYLHQLDWRGEDLARVCSGNLERILRREADHD